MRFVKAVLFLAASVAAIASAADYNVTLYEKSTLAGTELKPGDYRLEINGEKARLYNKKQSVEAPVKMESNGPKFSTTAVRYSNEGGQYRVIEIRLGGTNTRLTFNN